MANGRRGPALLAALIGFVLLAGIGALVRLDDSPPRAAAPATTTTTTTTAPPSTTTTVPQPQVPVSTTVATPIDVIATFDAPGGQQVGTAGLWYGYPMTMPVVEDRAEWLRIMLPERPNQSTAWVRRADVSLSTVPYRIVLNRATTTVTLYQSGFPVFTVPAAMGTARTPTPLGSYFVAVVERPGPSGYGPVVLDLSAHSEAITSWEGSGDAIIALHGPISAAADAQIGQPGLYISNGCVRLHEADQLRFADVPLGTPVDIVE